VLCVSLTSLTAGPTVEREARLAGQIVAADFYLRQVTFIEVLFDLSATELGFDPLAELRRGRHDVRQIVGTPFSEWLDAARRQWWAEGSSF
jgi:1,2-phenylacetyl-CoA epoxidase catalytic subunit